MHGSADGFQFPVDTHKLIPYQKYSSIISHGLIKSADD